LALWPSFAELGDVPEDYGYYVYELWGEAGCLYVGRVGNNGPGSVRKRFSGHRGKASWWPEVTRAIVSRFASHEEIVAEEPRRIRDLRPAHNRQYAGGAWLAAAEVGAAGDGDAYQAAYRQQPERKRREHARETGKARRSYYGRRNALPTVKQRKAQWARRASRRPGPGQEGLF
jgi:hypothetical protein